MLIKPLWLRQLKLPYFWGLGWGLFWVLSFMMLMIKPGMSDEYPPVTFESLPPLNEGVSFILPDGKKFTLPSGQRLETFLTLEDLGFGSLTLNKIITSINSSPENYSLDQFGYFFKANLGQVLNNVKGLGNYPLKAIPLFQNLLKSKGYKINKVQNTLLKDLVKQYPELNQLSFKNFDLSLYNLLSIPGLTNTPFLQFSNWQSLKVNEVPALVEFPLNFLNMDEGFAVVDLVLGKSEHPTNRSVSGSYQSGFNKNCTKNCAHIELAANPVVAGGQWISGKEQKVSGGNGCLKSVNGGDEPTGRHPYGNSFKVVVWNVDESTDKVDTVLFFRKKVWCGATPYFIGPIPFQTLSTGDSIFVGL
ncbi:hypothetical protein [Gloeothece verrucosa]|uniref:Uncharacterized protein n=1 Tax=Gloeothece verrucosa (strain PCC 7822) TaxID=497965 RepID=E0UNS8_GLOV7|nr:hypothetical protein [Gloeothece verrucosa]ADN18608.1 conserved hypothetical protein [Gloeothece verrucosa PCC 7822]